MSSEIYEHFKNINASDRVIGLFYLYMFIMVLIFAGNIITKGTTKKDLSWALYAICILLGILAIFSIWKGGHWRTRGGIILTILIVAGLMASMIFCDSTSTTMEKVGSHFANICFGLVTFIGLYMAHDIV